MTAPASPRREGHLFPYEAARRQHVVDADYCAFITSLEFLLTGAALTGPLQSDNNRAEPLASSAALSDLALFAKLDHGLARSSIPDRAVRATTYLIGNPVLTGGLFRHEPIVGQYVPLRVYVVASDFGTLVSYDLPSASLGQFQSPEMSAVAVLLDSKLYQLVLDACELAETEA